MIHRCPFGESSTLLSTTVELFPSPVVYMAEKHIFPDHSGGWNGPGMKLHTAQGSNTNLTISVIVNFEINQHVH